MLSSPGDLIGQTIDRYLIEEQLGTGAFGDVYRAKHTFIGRTVALKILREGREGSDAIARFVREAKAAAAAGSPNIVKVLDAGTADTGHFFLAMELLEGEELKTLMKREAPIAVAPAVDFGLQILSGLAAAHKAGVVHRDLKPSNVFVCVQRGNTVLKILDFGVSKFLTGDSEKGLTHTGQLVGTPFFMAPEQLVAAKDADARADVYALATILYRLLSGEFPFAASTIEQILVEKHTKRPRPLVQVCPTLPRALCEVVDRGLSRDPDGRWNSAAEMADALQRFTTGEEVPAQATLTAHSPPAESHSLPGSHSPPPAAQSPPQKGGVPETRENRNPPWFDDEPTGRVRPSEADWGAPTDTEEPTQLWQGGEKARASDDPLGDNQVTHELASVSAPPTAQPYKWTHGQGSSPSWTRLGCLVIGVLVVLLGLVSLALLAQSGTIQF